MSGEVPAKDELAFGDHIATPPELREGKAWAAADANFAMTVHHSSVAPVVQSDPVVEWRRGRLIAAGCAPVLAARLAGDSEIELHAVLDLLDRGCPPELAARILAPLDDARRPC